MASVVVGQLQFVVGECHFDSVMSFQLDGDHDDDRLAAIGSVEDQGIPTGELRQFQAPTSR